MCATKALSLWCESARNINLLYPLLMCITGKKHSCNLYKHITVSDLDSDSEDHQFCLLSSAHLTSNLEPFTGVFIGQLKIRQVHTPLSQLFQLLLSLVPQPNDSCCLALRHTLLLQFLQNDLQVINLGKVNACMQGARRVKWHASCV